MPWIWERLSAWMFPPHGPAEIHVFKGEVIAKAIGAQEKQSLLSGDAVGIRRAGSSARELRSSAFIQREEVSELGAGLAAAQRLRADAALEAGSLAHYAA